MRVEVAFHTPTVEEALAIGSNLRPDDLRELSSYGSVWSPARAVQWIQDPRTLVASVDGTPCALFGIGNDSPPYTPWMIATPLVDRHPLAMHRAARWFVHGWVLRYRWLGNFVLEDNRKTIGWLQVLGFHVSSETRQLNPRSGRFRWFWWKHED